MNRPINANRNYGCALSSLAEQATRLHQVRKNDVRLGDQLYVITANSVYHVRVAGDGWYLVSGGWFDRKGVAPLKTRIAGCTWGGSALKVDVVAACGLCVEFGNRVVTSPVRRVIVVPYGSEY